MTPTDIQRLFHGVPGMFAVLRADADFSIVAASQDYLRITRTDAAILGRPLFEAFPDNPGLPDADGVGKLRASLQRVIASRSADTMAAQRYDVRLPPAQGGSYEERHWLAVNSPVLDDSGAVEYIIHRVEDAAAKARQAQADREQLLAESETHRRMYETALNSTPDFVYVFDLEHRALYANDALLRTWGVDDVRGKKWMDLGYEQWHADMHDRELDTVIATRAPIRGEIPFTGTGGRRVYDYIFAPVLGPDGQVVAVAGTTRDITERQNAEQSIREQAQRLADSDRVKDEFLATLSHELRNPLAPLRNAIALLRMDGSCEGDKPAEVLAMMERQVNHLVRLVDDLLEVSRISRGTLSLRQERVELAAVVRNALETSDPLVKAAGHQLSVDLPDAPLWLEGDPVRLAQILANLLNNAAKYTEGQGRISVRAWQDQGQALVSVRDTGIGMDPAEVPRMFEMFSRGNRDSGHGQGGLGIGLALSRRLAQMHGGSVEAHSEGPGKGSEFTVRLPLAPDTPAAAGTQPAQDADLGRTRVLVVDDNHDAGDSLAMLLEMLGAQVKVARNGAQALEIYAGYRAPVVLLDIGMPGMNGYDVARALRSRYPERPPLLIALTGWGQEDDRRRASDAGFDHHLVKPAEIGALQHLLATVESKAAA